MNMITLKELQNPETEQALLERYGGIGLDKQSSLADVIGDNNWNVDILKGEISFGSNLTFPIQVLGTFSHSSKTWLWGWANKQSNLPDSILEQSLQLKEYGEKHAIDLLQNESFDATINDAHLIGLIASGLFKTSAYYVGDYGSGAIVVTINGEMIDQSPSIDKARISTIFPQLISIFPMDHKNAFICYLAEKGYSLTVNENTVVAIKGEEKMTGTFDEQSRLTSLQA